MFCYCACESSLTVTLVRSPELFSDFKTQM
jgi:hypothetical protein